jgi:hypothetical protein
MARARARHAPARRTTTGGGSLLLFARVRGKRRALAPRRRARATRRRRRRRARLRGAPPAEDKGAPAHASPGGQAARGLFFCSEGRRLLLAKF